MPQAYYDICHGKAMTNIDLLIYK